MYPLREIEPWQHDVYMREALKEAEAAAERDEVPVGCIIVCHGKIIARGHNLTQTLTDVTAHAEMQAITAAANWLGGKYLADCVIYVTVEPCLMCAAALGWAQIGGVVLAPRPQARLSELLRAQGSANAHSAASAHAGNRGCAGG